MPLKDGSLTRGEQAFAMAYAELGDVKAAEKKAGIATNHGYAVLKRPEVQREIVAQQTARMTAEALPLAVQTLINVMGSEKAPAAARVQAAKVVLDRTLGANGEGQAKDIHEMTPEELAQAISTLEAQAASMAKPVSAPSPFE
jgi:hypothetical protein